MKRVKLSDEHALVLQQINDFGEEDFTGLVQELRMERSRMANILQLLHHKKLIVVQRSPYAELWVRLSAKGKRLAQHLWPTAMVAA